MHLLTLIQIKVRAIFIGLISATHSGPVLLLRGKALIRPIDVFRLNESLGYRTCPRSLHDETSFSCSSKDSIEMFGIREVFSGGTPNNVSFKGFLGLMGRSRLRAAPFCKKLEIPLARSRTVLRMHLAC